MPFVVLINQFCMRHQAHLMSKKQLQRLVEYWRALAKASNCMRQYAHKFQAATTSQFGAEFAKRVCAKVCPQPLKGRWAAIHNAEDYFRSFGWRELPSSFVEVFLTRSTAVPARPANGVGILDDDEERFGEKHNRWAREAYTKPNGLESLEFWLTLEISFQSRGPGDTFGSMDRINSCRVLRQCRFQVCNFCLQSG